MSDEAIRREARHARRARLLGSGARCAQCGLTDLHALQRVENTILCYECMQASRGKATVEQHHVLGRTNDTTTIGVPGNQHRALSELQLDWPHATRYNTERDPLLWLAAMCRSLKDHLTYWIAWLGQIAQWLESASRALCERCGARWWTTLELQPLWGGTPA